MFLSILVGLVIYYLIFTDIIYGERVKKPFRTDTEINFYCSKVEPQNPHCQQWREITQKRLELESIIFDEIKNFCQANPQNPQCKKNTKISIFTFCTQFQPENNYCLQWQNIKQGELKVKGILSEEIRKFCQKNYQHFLCRNKIN